MEVDSVKKIIGSFAKRLVGEQTGQAFVWTALLLTAILGMGGLMVDLGHAYIVRGDLQNYANAAALAAAGDVYNTSKTDDANAIATAYGTGSTGENYNSSLGTITQTITPKCLTLLLPSGSKCTTGSPANALQVTESDTLNTYFMRVLGFKTITVTATATASMQGMAEPWNVAIILDDTGSMLTSDTNCVVGGKTLTEFACATEGIQAMLAATDPCAAGATNCSSSNSSTNFRVALFMFPGVSYSYTAGNLSTYANGGASLSYLTNCNGTTTTPSFMLYTLPPAGAASYAPITYKLTASPNTPFTATYEVTYGASDADANGFVSDYYSPSSSNGLNSSASIVQAVTGCMVPEPTNWNSGNSKAAPVMQAASTGGVTYFAGAIYAAQAALTAEQTTYPKSKNAIIMLTDGQAQLSTSTGNFPTAYTASPSTSGLNTLTSNGTYPSGVDECQQAIAAAQAATKAGTTVFGVAYGAEQSGCGTAENNFVADSTLILTTGLNAPFSPISQLTPCVTMENIASSLTDFYSDYNQSGSGSTCEDNSHSVVSLQDILLAISASFTKPRLLPNNAQ
jgi:Flp pilus assembly protein TadG